MNNSGDIIRLSDRCSKRDIASWIEPRPPLITNPYLRPKPNKGVNLMSAFEESVESSDDFEAVQVYLRLRPCINPSPLYNVTCDKRLITRTDTTTAGHGRRTQLNVSKAYEFTHIFRPDTTQKEIFDKVVKDNLNKLLDGHSYNLLTYGASGSGKTFTLMGTINSPGLVPRSLEYLFKIVDAAQQPLYKPSDSGGVDTLSPHFQDVELKWSRKLCKDSEPVLRDKYRRMSVILDNASSNLDLSSRKQHFIWVSMVEIYNESLYDLLAGTDRRTAAAKLRIREDPNTGLVYAKGLTQAFVRSGVEAYDVMVAGKRNLQVASTGVHDRSSRSHCIFTITLITVTDSGVRTSFVRLCDLAGCERAAKTLNTGARMLESRAINTSLHVLERCLHALRLRKPDVIVPYRQSKLTRLLGSGLSGSRGEAVSMVVTLNPDRAFVAESRHVLQLAAVVSDIQLNQTILPPSDSILMGRSLTSASSLMTSTVGSTMTSDSGDDNVFVHENIMLRATIDRLEYELQQERRDNARLEKLIEDKQALMQECVERAKTITTNYYTAKLDLIEKQHAKEVAELNEELEYYKRRLEAVTNLENKPEDITQVNTNQLQSDDEDIDEDNVDTIEKYDQIYSDDDDESTTPTKQDVVLVTDSETEDELNHSLEPRFKIINKHRQSKIRHTLHQNEHTDSENESDETSDSENIISTQSNLTVTKENNQTDNSKESVIDKTPNDSENQTNIEGTEHQESTEGYESFTDMESNAKKSETFVVPISQIKIVNPLYSTQNRCDTNQNTVSKTNVDLLKRDDCTKRGTYVINDSSDTQSITNTKSGSTNYLEANESLPVIKRRTDSLAQFEQFEKDFKSKYNGYNAKFNENDEMLDQHCDNKVTNKSNDKTKLHNDETIHDKQIEERTKKKPSKPYFQYNESTSVEKMVTLDLNSQQSEKFFRDQEIKKKNNNISESFEFNPLIVKTISKDSNLGTSKNSIDIFDELSNSITNNCTQAKNYPVVKTNSDIEKVDNGRGLLFNKDKYDSKKLSANCHVAHTVSNITNNTTREFSQLVEDISELETEFEKIAANINENNLHEKPESQNHNVSTDKIINKLKKVSLEVKELEKLSSNISCVKSPEKNELRSEKHVTKDKIYDTTATNNKTYCKENFTENINAHTISNITNNTTREFSQLVEDISELETEFEKITTKLNENNLPEKSESQNHDENTDKIINQLKKVSLEVKELEKLSSNILFVESPEENELRSQNHVTEKKLYDITITNDSTYCEEKFTENVKQNLVTMLAENSQTEEDNITKNIEVASKKKQNLVTMLAENSQTEEDNITKNIEVASKDINKISNVGPKLANIVNKFNAFPTEFEMLAKNIDKTLLKHKHGEDNLKTLDPNTLSKNDEIKASKSDKIQNNDIKNPCAKNYTIPQPIDLDRQTETVDNVNNGLTKQIEVAKINKSKASSIQNDITTQKELNLRYNLRHKTDNIVTKMDDIGDRSHKTTQNDEFTTISSTVKKIKKNLRLRKQKNTTESNERSDEGKLKDIANLRREYADVMMNEPVPEKTVQKSPSPEVKCDEENIPPDSLSVTRSRRKLFTPRVDLLDVSGHNEALDSGERIKIPRPSYHKPRTRRRLN